MLFFPNCPFFKWGPLRQSPFQCCLVIFYNNSSVLLFRCPFFLFLYQTLEHCSDLFRISRSHDCSKLKLTIDEKANDNVMILQTIRFLWCVVLIHLYIFCQLTTKICFEKKNNMLAIFIKILSKVLLKYYFYANS